MESKHLPTFGPSSVFAMAYGSPLAFFFSSFALLVASIPGLVPVGVAEPSFYDPSRVTQLFWRPRIFLYKGFLSDEERDHIIKLVGEEQDDEVDCGGQRVREGPDEQRADELRRVPTEASDYKAVMRTITCPCIAETTTQFNPQLWTQIMERVNECGYSTQQESRAGLLHGPSFQRVIPYDIFTMHDFSSSLHLLNNSGDKQKMVNPFKYYATGMVRSTNRILTIFMIQRTKRLAAFDTPPCSCIFLT
ncbi:hypothetical protein MUK42_11882 [Musa troglodytarum]|uniref:Uncharacterized protein n=1 Tax=Musa troglodytarum TaxID=320322 RepID=A0A9E7KIS6_9LILI|nr:hypothetical protein MUK42_11882 [Musa troglodytarum]